MQAAKTQWQSRKNNANNQHSEWPAKSQLSICKDTTLDNVRHVLCRPAVPDSAIPRCPGCGCRQVQVGCRLYPPHYTSLKEEEQRLAYREYLDSFNDPCICEASRASHIVPIIPCCSGMHRCHCDEPVCGNCDCSDDMSSTGSCTCCRPPEEDPSRDCCDCHEYPPDVCYCDGKPRILRSEPVRRKCFCLQNDHHTTLMNPLCHC
ncbi:hypothetical protein CRM22_003809 [Opisthorchis felineus]|uniref:Uncharacterized protein n=1 Tax=Opisthorchis felineus TaxID=147828 RepID=A0A4S2LZC4_OPIFE|nr:hypothetical protein CRM22_003809 [Opisthorchis felineus]